MAMAAPRDARLFVCYVPGLDQRQLTAGRTPFLERLRSTHPTIAISALPGPDLLPTLISGVYPHEHRLWDVSLRLDARLVGRPRWTDHVPDVLTTTLQHARHVLDRSYELPALPLRRRRQFDIHRLPGGGRPRDEGTLERIGNFRTVFGILGADARYDLLPRLGSLAGVGDTLATGTCGLQFLEVRALDRFQHWNMDQPPLIDHAYRVVDDFVGRIHAGCQQRGVTLMVLVDHGQERVTGTIPLVDSLRHAPIHPQDFSYFVGTTLARFWFHSEEARVRLSHALHEMPHARVLSRRDLRALHIDFEDDAYGELYLSADPGWIFFPHDFHHPLANLVLALMDRDQRPRLNDPRQRGAHGYLPEHASEKGFAILADTRLKPVRSQAEPIDVAPTLLSLLGVPPPAYMRGRIAFA